MFVNTTPTPLYVEVLTLEVIVFEDGAFERGLGLDEVMRWDTF